MSQDGGIMQVNTTNYPEYTIDQLLDPELNIKLGCEKLSEFMKLYDMSLLGIAGYNGGLLDRRPKKSIMNALVYAAIVNEEVKELDKLINNRELINEK